MNRRDPFHLLARFPSEAERVREFLRSSESFADLCADYEEVVAALVRIEDGVVPNTPERVAELRDLRAALANELAQALQDHAVRK